MAPPWTWGHSGPSWFLADVVGSEQIRLKPAGPVPTEPGSRSQRVPVRQGLCVLGRGNHSLGGVKAEVHALLVLRPPVPIWGGWGPVHAGPPGPGRGHCLASGHIAPGTGPLRRTSVVGFRGHPESSMSSS